MSVYEVVEVSLLSKVAGLFDFFQHLQTRATSESFSGKSVAIQYVRNF